ncbi:MAG TPA: hypothetical protein PKC20_16285, partial [Burkholderiaceae bacterium]|nr:hypothetical protein [Burkholderiaceae bacterium]
MTVDPAFAHVALDVPLPETFDYRIPDDWRPEVGDWVVVPWGTSRRVGLVAGLASGSEVPAERLKPLEAPLAGMPRMPRHWLDFVAFGARYYHAGLGELALPSVPKLLRAAPSARSRGPATGRARGRFDAGTPARAVDAVDAVDGVRADGAGGPGGSGGAGGS